MNYSIVVMVLASAALATAYKGSGYAAPGGLYGPTFKSNVAIFGSKDWKVSYLAEQKNEVGTLLCCEAKGYNSKNKETWYKIGCSNNGPVKQSVPWGNNIAEPEIRCKGIPLGTSYIWTA